MKCCHVDGDTTIYGGQGKSFPDGTVIYMSVGTAEYSTECSNGMWIGDMYSTESTTPTSTATDFQP